MQNKCEDPKPEPKLELESEPLKCRAEDEDLPSPPKEGQTGKEGRVNRMRVEDRLMLCLERKQVISSTIALARPAAEAVAKGGTRAEGDAAGASDFAEFKSHLYVWDSFDLSAIQPALSAAHRGASRAAG